MKDLGWIEVTKEEVLQLINKLKTDKSPSKDGIHTGVLKELKCKLMELTKICNQPLKSASVPKVWKVVNVNLILKMFPEKILQTTGWSV